MSLYVPVAVNCTVAPTCALAGFGVTAMEVSEITVKLAVPLTPVNVAVMTEDPPATPVASPVLAPIVATLAVPELHVT